MLFKVLKVLKRFNGKSQSGKDASGQIPTRDLHGTAVAGRRHVALIVETSVVYGRQILRGIAQYQRTHQRWSVYLEERELNSPPPDWLSTWTGDGVICRSTTPEWAKNFRRRRIPVVDLNDRHLQLKLPRVASDMQQIGQMGALHLLERGFQQLAFCGFSNEVWSEQRREGFIAAANGRVAPEAVYESPWHHLRSRPWQAERDRIAAWLQKLPRPIGIMACNDARGQHVLDACAQIKARVPDEIAVLGVDNAETFCELCDPPLSSIAPNPERIGYEAAALLDRLMAGADSSAEHLLIPAREVVTRQSTDVYAVSDPLVLSAVRFIREHALEGISIAHVIRQAHCSRSTLERRFREHLGHSPQDEMRSVVLRRIKQLLIETDWTLARISAAVSIAHVEYLSVFFKRETGESPTDFRRRHQVGE